MTYVIFYGSRILLEIGLRNGLPFIAQVDPTAAVPVG